MSKKKAASKPASQGRKTSAAADACAQGGSHEWEPEDGGTFCKKCHEAKPKAKRAAANKPTQPKVKDSKLSAIDAAAKVLAESKEPLNAKAMIEAMSAKGYWISPGGKTPWATLYSAILSEITKKGKEARFKKTERGHFAPNA